MAWVAHLKAHIWAEKLFEITQLHSLDPVDVAPGQKATFSTTRSHMHTHFVFAGYSHFIHLANLEEMNSYTK